MAQLNRTVAEVNRLLDELARLLDEGGSGFELANSLSDLQSPGMATSSSLSGLIFNTAISQGIGICDYNDTTIPMPEMSSVTKVKSVVYYERSKKIYATGEDGKLHNNWSDSSVTPFAYQKREFLCGFDGNSPIAGKVYLMRHAQTGNLGLYFFNGNAMVQLIDFNVVTEMAKGPKVEHADTLSGIPADVGMVDISISSPQSLSIAGTPKSGHRIEIFVFCEEGTQSVTLPDDPTTWTHINGNTFSLDEMESAKIELTYIGSLYYTTVMKKYADASLIVK